VNLGDESERYMLESLGRITSSAADWGMPVLAMVYARGPKIEDEFAPEIVAHCARAGEELGADVVKVPYTGEMKTFSKVVDCCCIPVVIAGGPKLDSTEALFRMVHDSVQAGGAGLSVGRNVFQHQNVPKLTKALDGLVHQDWDVDEAVEYMGQDL